MSTSTHSSTQEEKRGVFQPALGAVIERRSGMPAEEFYRDYVMKLRPVIITDALKDWPALDKWTPQYFAEHYPEKTITFRNGSTMQMGEFIGKVMNSTAQSPAPYWTNAPLKTYFPELLSDIDSGSPYFKPNWAARNYLHKGMQSSLQRGSMIELYIGGNGGAFPIVHWDGLSSHAFLMQIYGRKRYYAWPYEDSACMYPQDEPPNLSQIQDVENPDLEKFPMFAKARLTTFVLEPGEMLFMPSRWWHTAKMLTPSITLSINTVNQSNWSNFTKDMNRKATAAGLLLKSAYLFCSMLRNEIVDLVEMI